MANPFLSQILASVLGGAIGGRQRGGPLGGGMGSAGMGGGGLGDVLGGMLGGRGAAPMGLPTGRGGLGGGKGMLLALMLPLAMQWVQRNGGIGNVLQRFRQKGYTQQAASWVSTGENEGIDAHAVGDVLGDDELSRMSQQLGVGQDEVAHGFAEILPEMVNQLTPQGEVPHDADQVLDGGLSSLEQMLSETEQR